MPQRRQPVAKPNKFDAPLAAKSYRFVPLFGLILVLLLVLVVYSPALRGGVLWDDPGHITTPELRSIAGLYRIWFELGATQQYYPLLHSAFWLEHQLWGDSVLGYHLVNVFWHSLSVVLLYLIVARLKIPGALLAAAIFALHPVMVESVAWISEQKNTLSAVFYFGAMLVYLRFDESRRRSHPTRALYWLSLGLFMLGLLTKTVIATLPAALLVIFWWQRGRLTWGDVKPLIPYFVLGAAAGLITAWVEQVLIGAEGADFQLSMLQRSLIAGRVIWFYLAKLFWPVNLMFIYPRWEIDPMAVWQWIFPVAAAATTVVLWSIRGRTRAPLAGWLLFVGTLFPVLGFLNIYPFIYSFVADHFQYLASVGMIVLTAAGLASAVSKLTPIGRQIGGALCVFVIAVLATLSWRQSHMYADAVTLYRTTIKRNPQCFMAFNNLGMELAAQGNYHEAIGLYRSSLAIRPDFAQTQNNLGFALTQVGRPEEAVGNIEEALRLRPDFAEANINLGIALQQLGRTMEAIECVRKVVAARPNYAEAHSNLGNLLIQIGRVAEGVAKHREALAIKPVDPSLLNNLGIALMYSGRASDAVEPLQRAVRIKKGYYQAYNSLGLVLARMGNNPEAIDQFKIALRINPNYANAHCNLANVLAGTGELTNAIVHYKRAVAIRPDFAEAQYKLAVLLTQSEQPTEALDHYHAAMRAEPSNLQIYASLAQTYALLGRSEEAIITAEKGINLASSTKQVDERKQFEDWLRDFHSKLVKAEAESSGSESRSSGAEAQTR
jgi:tetratricopeptide (TPR) repeat protein